MLPNKRMLCCVLKKWLHNKLKVELFVFVKQCLNVIKQSMHDKKKKYISNHIPNTQKMSMRHLNILQCQSSINTPEFVFVL